MHFIENHWVYHEIWVFIDSSFLGVPHEAKKPRKKLAVFSASWVGLLRAPLNTIWLIKPPA